MCVNVYVFEYVFYCRDLNLRNLSLPDGSIVPTKMSHKLRRKVKRALRALTVCPVVFKWHDLGVRFWPRWIKRGVCPSRVSCSVPPGMVCR